MLASKHSRCDLPMWSKLSRAPPAFCIPSNGANSQGRTALHPASSLSTFPNIDYTCLTTCKNTQMGLVQKGNNALLDSGPRMVWIIHDSSHILDFSKLYKQKLYKNIEKHQNIKEINYTFTLPPSFSPSTSLTKNHLRPPSVRASARSASTSSISRGEESCSLLRARSGESGWDAKKLMGF